MLVLNRLLCDTISLPVSELMYSLFNFSYFVITASRQLSGLGQLKLSFPSMFAGAVFTKEAVGLTPVIR